MTDELVPGEEEDRGHEDAHEEFVEGEHPIREALEEVPEDE